MKNIDELYSIYISTVSSKQATADIDIIKFMMEKINEYKPATVADMGSGFSSAVLSTYEHGSVDSVDDNYDWLDKTKAFLNEHDLHKEDQKIIHFVDFRLKKKKYDFVFYDIGMTRPTRIEHMEETTTQNVNEGGYILYDDLHKGDLRQRLDRVKTVANLHFISKTKIDEYGRFAELYQYRGLR